MENITEQLIETIYKRAMQYCVAKYGSEPNNIILNDGSFSARWVTNCCGEYSEDSEYFEVEDLTADLDVLYIERKAKEQAERLAAENERKKREHDRKQQDKERRRNEYIKLKKEFEP